MIAAGRCIDEWLARRVDAATRTWLAETAARVASDGGGRALFLAFSAATRRVGRETLGLGTTELAQASLARPDWRPGAWTVDQAARTHLVLALPADDAAPWLATLDRLFATSGLEELVALYQALPLLPHAGLLAGRAAEGVRSNMQAVFAAVAFDNPYPAERLDEAAWNQLVLKALFVGGRLFTPSRAPRLIGLERRANPRLARMLADYARERRAAGRMISDDLWPVALLGADDALTAELIALRDHPSARTPPHPSQSGASP